MTRRPSGVIGRGAGSTAVLVLFVACASGSGSGAAADDPASVFGALEVGADYASTFTRLNKQPFRSEDHGNRWVNTYVNPVGLEAFFARAAIHPVGSVVIKESFEDDGGKPGSRRGPIFVMEKRAAGFAPDAGDWFWALHWAEPSGSLGAQLGGPTYWRSPSNKVAYCWKCHVNWKHQDWVGGVPDEVIIDNPLGSAPAKAPESSVGVQEIQGEDF